MNNVDIKVLLSIIEEIRTIAQQVENEIEQIHNATNNIVTKAKTLNSYNGQDVQGSFNVVTYIDPNTELEQTVSKWRVWKIEHSDEIIALADGVEKFVTEIADSIPPIISFLNNSLNSIDLMTNEIDRLNNNVGNTMDAKTFSNSPLSINIANDEYSAVNGEFVGIKEENMQWWTDKPLKFVKVFTEDGRVAYRIDQQDDNGTWVGMGFTDVTSAYLYLKALSGYQGAKSKDDFWIRKAADEKKAKARKEASSHSKDEMLIQKAADEKKAKDGKEASSYSKDEMLIQKATEEKKTENVTSFIDEDKQEIVETPTDRSYPDTNSVKNTSNSIHDSNVIADGTSLESGENYVKFQNLDNTTKKEYIDYITISNNKLSSQSDKNVAYNNLSDYTKKIVDGEIKLTTPIENAETIASFVDQRQDIIVPAGKHIYINGEKIIGSLDSDMTFQYDAETEKYRMLMSNGNYSYGGYNLEEIANSEIK